MSEQLTTKKSVFDFDKLEKVSVEVKYDAPVALTDRADLAKFKDEELLLFANKHLRSEAKKAARASIQGLNAAVVMQFIAKWRDMPQFSGIAKRSEQTKAILVEIKTKYPPLLEVLKEMSAAASAKEEDDDDNESDE